MEAPSRTDKTENLPAPAAIPTLKVGGLFLVKIKNANIPFLVAAGLMVKLALASLPAAIIVAIAVWTGADPWALVRQRAHDSAGHIDQGGTLGL